MRSAPSSREFVARGDYVYRCDGHIAPLSESWQLLQVGDRYEIVSERVVPGQALVLSAWAQIEQGAIRRCLVQWRGQGGTKCQAVAAYRRDHAHPARAVYRYRRDGLPAASVSAGGMHYFPLMRIFSGQLFGALMRERGRGEVLVPWVQDPTQADKLLTPDLSTRTLEYLGEAEAADGLGNLECFRYAGGQYEHGAEYRLRDGLLWEYRWRQGESTWRVQLENFQGQWPGAALWPLARFAMMSDGQADAEMGR